MNAIQGTAKIGADRRTLRLERPLPESVSAGQVNITLFITPPRAEQPPRGEETNENSPTPLSDWLSGILASAGDISAEELREERLQRWIS